MGIIIKFLSVLAVFIFVASLPDVASAKVSNMVLSARAGVLPTCYLETFGTRSGILHCSARDSKAWQEPQDTKLLIRCPDEGWISGQIVFAEMESCITSTEHQLTIIDGGIGRNFILMQLEVNNTVLLDYTANVYIN